MESYKITVLGDIMCEPPFLQAAMARKEDFYTALEPLKGLLSEADYVIGNMETPVAGEEMGYTEWLASFNAPDSFPKAIKALGVNLVSTANNHAVDRGMEGMRKTLDKLDEIGLSHTGTRRNETEDRAFYFTLGKTRIAVVASTYGVNETVNHVKLSDDDRKLLNLHIAKIPGLKQPSNTTTTPQQLRTRALFEELLGRELSWEEGVRLKNAMGVPNPYADDRFEPVLYDEGMKWMEETIREAGKKADLILVLPHSGGQFNPAPGLGSRYVMKKILNMGADAIFMAHSHTTQPADILNGVPCFYSLGNVTMYGDTIWSTNDSLPDFGLAAHIYIRDGVIERTTFSVIRIVITEDHYLSVVPADELYDSLKDRNARRELADRAADVVSRVTGLPRPERPKRPKREYELR
ncbi:MAG: CapA family protein [Lachnospiraceae bacterium]|nr:CapA family protein [Lachnospiraceae bacterium]